MASRISTLDPAVKPKAEPTRSGPAIKLTTGKATDVCERFVLSEQGVQHLTAAQTPIQFISLLSEKKSYPDAVRVLAHGLPKREAVWWACRCLREYLGATPREKTRLALEAAEKWSRAPTEETRRAAQKAAEGAGYGTPAGLTAMAAFWSGGSLTPPDAPVVPPDDDMT